MEPRRFPLRGAPSVSLSLIVAVLAFASMGVVPTARAEGDAAVAVLGFEALEGAPDNVATEITDALRQRVAATKGYQLVQGKDLVEVKLVFACPDEAPACMSQAGKSMGATKVIFGNVKRAGPDYQVTLKLLDVAKGAVETWATEAVPRRRAEPAAFRALAPVWIAKLAGRNAGGSLQIRANVQGAAVSLDGTRVGVTADKPVVITDVAPGRHEVAVEREGYTTTKQEFSLAAGQSLPLRLALSPLSADVNAAPMPEDTPPVLVRKPRDALEPEGERGEESHTGARVAFWVAVAMTATAAGVGVHYLRAVQQTNDALNEYRRLFVGEPRCPVSPSGQCYSSGEPAPARTQADLDKISTLKQQGQSDQRWQIGAFAVSAGFALVGGYFLYRGYLAGGSEEKSTASRGLRIFPTATASAGGIVTEFDF